MSNSYVLGRGRENNLIVKLRKKGWFAIRGSGSKAGMVIVEGKKYFPIDIVAVKKDGKHPKVLFIQVSKYFYDIDSIEKKYLKVWAKTVQATPLLAFTFEKRSTKNKKRGSWVFIDLSTNENIEL
tara:strand:+ start:292 stop:666 length:375 start_codon:yes stop_codon:yes gene_type:complete